MTDDWIIEFNKATKQVIGGTLNELIHTVKMGHELRWWIVLIELA